jgi:predicted MPP superfamily phosphohydrolase
MPVYVLPVFIHRPGVQCFPCNLLIGLVQPNGTGLHHIGQRMRLQVSAGTGYRAPPSRPGVPSGITSIRLLPA